MHNSSNNWALLIIDMQKDFIDFVAPLSAKKESLVANIKTLCSIAENNNLPIFLIKDSHEIGDSEFLRFKPHCIKNTTGWEIIDELANLKARTIQKHSYSAFNGTTLTRTLKRSGVRKVIISGVQTHICILSTSIDAFHLGYETIIVPECVESISPYRRKIALQWMHRYTGQLVNISNLQDLLQNSISGDKETE